MTDDKFIYLMFCGGLPLAFVLSWIIITWMRRCKHDWRFAIPDDVSMTDEGWREAKICCVCKKCSAMDFRTLPQPVIKPELNALELVHYHRMRDLVKHGYKFIDIEIRKDGQTYNFEGDWLARSNI